jgi:choline kinase
MFDVDKKVVKIGKKLPDKDRCNGEFIGMMKCSKRGAGIYRAHFNSLRKTHSGKPFHETAVFEKAYLTDMIQDMAGSGIPVFCVTVEGGWMEVDTVEDYEKLLARSSLANKGSDPHDNRY